MSLLSVEMTVLHVCKTLAVKEVAVGEVDDEDDVKEG